MITKSDPRVPGGTYWSGYWHESYQVQAIFSILRSRTVYIVVRWSDGHSTQHCTPWDARRDKVLS